MSMVPSFGEEIFLLPVDVPFWPTLADPAQIPGSKIKIASMIHMALELLAVKLGYQILGLWTVKTDTEITSKTK